MWDESGTEGTGGEDDTGETGEPMPEGQSYRCQGTGNGWAQVKLDLGSVIACVNQPEPLSVAEQLAVTVDDCKGQPLDLQNLPNWDGIIEPAACCGELAEPENIEAACVEDCGWVACKLAIGALRKAADAIDYGVLSGDLDEFANFLEMPDPLATCAGDVRIAAKDENGPQFAQLDLGEASSSKAAVGHVNNLTLFIQCALDEEQPVVLDEAAGTCTDPTNIPIPSEESNGGGMFTNASATVFGPSGDASVDLPRITFGYTEQLCAESQCGFNLTGLAGTIPFVELGDYTFENVSYSLSTPAPGMIAGETVTFPAGAVRLDVSADATLAGEPIWRAASGTFEVHNTSPATASRTASGFAITELELAVGDELLVLSSESAPFVLTQ